MYALVVTLAALAVTFAFLWHRAAVRRDEWMFEAVAKAGRVAHLMRQLDAAEAPLKARIAELTKSSHKTLMDLGGVILERNDSRGEAMMWKSFAQACVGIEDAERAVEIATAELTRELAEVPS